jgi:hypothetical protein
MSLVRTIPNPHLLPCDDRREAIRDTLPMQAPSKQSRQNRLQHLTTQLLWRLQQSSPYHSSSTSNLILPILPEATPILGAPTRPAKLLPGLEESRGALYELGVSDDGSFVGLTPDEMEESLTNLKAMAASLGCNVELLRTVVVGSCRVDRRVSVGPRASKKVHRSSGWRSWFSLIYIPERMTSSSMATLACLLQRAVPQHRLSSAMVHWP